MNKFASIAYGGEFNFKIIRLIIMLHTHPQKLSRKIRKMYLIVSFQILDCCVVVSEGGKFSMIKV